MEIPKLDHPDQYGSLYKAFGMVAPVEIAQKIRSFVVENQKHGIWR